ncbi:MAG: hypothetical protein ACRD0W_00125 [Acidimicrobiales bacterium]
MNICQQAARPHQHLYDPGTGEPTGRIRAYARDRSWVVDVTDDGSICARYVTPTPPTWPPEKVLAFLMGELHHNETAERRLRPDRKGRTR